MSRDGCETKAKGGAISPNSAFPCSPTQAAADRVADAKIRVQRTEIERLRAQVRESVAGAAQMQAWLTAAEES